MTFVRRFVPVVFSALVPGLGQALRGRPGDAALFLGVALYLHWILAGCACQVGAPTWSVGAFLVGPAGFPGGFAMPVAVVVALIACGVHALAGWDARVRDPAHTRAASQSEPLA